MTANRAIRASDHDREHVVEILRAQYTEGRLTLAEFDDRMAAAYESKTWGDLLDLTSDLPVDVRLGTDLATRPAAEWPAAEWPAAERPADQPARRSPPSQFVPLVPLLIAAAVVAWLAGGGLGASGYHHGNHVLAFVFSWPLVVIVVLALKRAVRRGGPFR